MAVKKWHLHEHVNDIFDWWGDVHHADWYEPPDEQLRFLAYERWLNDRELLTIEDGYEWRYARAVHDPERSPSPSRPTHTTSFTYVAVEVLEETEGALKGTGLPKEIDV